MADTTADQGGMKKTLSLWNFFTIGFGAIIGTGWVLQVGDWMVCLLYTSPSPRDLSTSRMPSSA